MKLTLTQHAHVTVARLPENLVMSNADSTRDALNQLIDQGHRHLVLDLQPVEFMDSSGLAVLIALYKRLSNRRGRLVLLSPTSNVRALIELTRLHQLFDIYEDDQAAISDLLAA